MPIAVQSDDRCQFILIVFSTPRYPSSCFSPQSRYANAEDETDQIRILMLICFEREKGGSRGEVRPRGPSLSPAAQMKAAAHCCK